MSGDVKFSLESDEFMMAFAMEIFEGDSLEYDPRYVRWVVRTWEYANAQRIENYFPLHLCTAEELRKFYDAESAEVDKEMAKD